MAIPPRSQPPAWPDDPDAPAPTIPLEGWGDFDTTLRRKDASREEPQDLKLWSLVVYAGSNLGRIFPLQLGDNVLGRSPQAQITLLDEEVSRLHACVRLTCEEGTVRLTVEDMGSTNGTFVNHHPVQGCTPLDPGDRITIGSHVLKLVAMDSLERSFHETLLDQSTRDPLTGLNNRGTTLEELQSRFELSRRHNRPMTVVMCDLDHFKRINDTLGHGAGDMVLAGFGERVRQDLRGTDIAGRIGGEEFLFILPETDLPGAALLAERIRISMESAPFTLPNGPLSVTCSLGIAACAPCDRNGGDLLGRADGALYQAKRQGRNQVGIAPEKP